MLLSQQAQLHRLDDHRAVVRVAGNWIAMVQSRLPLLEGAMAKALGSPRQVSLEAGDAGLPRAQAGLQPPEPGTASAISAVAVAPTTTMAAAAAPAPAPGTAKTLESATLPVLPGSAPMQPRPPARAFGQESTGDATTNSPGPELRPQAAPPTDTKLDHQAQRLAEFFNGEVVVDGDGF
jgi:DNA polymerase-3 subunit gamma/tau